MGAGGVQWPCLGTQSTQATCGIPFDRVLPVFTPSTVSFGPKMAPNGPQQDPVAQVGLIMAEIEVFLQK